MTNKSRHKWSFSLGLWAGLICQFIIQDRHGSKEAYIQYLQEMPETWGGWIQFPIWLTVGATVACIAAAVILEPKT